MIAIIDENVNNRDGFIGYEPILDPLPQLIEEANADIEVKVEEVTQIKVEEAVNVESEEESTSDNTPDNDDQSIDSISITDSMLEKDDDIEEVEEGGETGDIPRLIPRGDTNTQQSSLRRGSRVRPEIDYKSLSGVREYNANRQMMQLSKKLVRMENPGANHKKLKGKRRKTVVGMKDTFRKVTEIMMAQLEQRPMVNAKEEIKRYGEKAIYAILLEYGQIDDMKTFEPLEASKMTHVEKRQALNMLTMVKEKRDKRLKGRAVADGIKQRLYIKKEDVASPTVKLESLILSLLIDAYENRDVATADVVGSYLIADMKDHVIVKLTGESVDIMCQANAKY